MRIAAITAAAAITAKHPIMIAALSMPCMAQSVSPARAAHCRHDGLSFYDRYDLICGSVTETLL